MQTRCGVFAVFLATFLAFLNEPVAVQRREASATRPVSGQDGLVGWWNMDETAGTTVHDASGNDNTGVIEGNFAWSSGRIAGAIELDGRQDSIIRIPNSPTLRRTANQITVMAWTYRTRNRNVAVVSHNYPDLFFGFHGSQFKWQIRNASDQYAECYSGNATLNQWFHIAATYDGAMARLFVDGAEICHADLTGAIPMRDGPFMISGYLNTPGSPDFDKDARSGIVDEMPGKIDEVRIYDRALSASEINAVYSKGAV